MGIFGQFREKLDSVKNCLIEVESKKNSFAYI